MCASTCCSFEPPDGLRTHDLPCERRAYCTSPWEAKLRGSNQHTGWHRSEQHLWQGHLAEVTVRAVGDRLDKKGLATQKWRFLERWVAPQAGWLVNVACLVIRIATRFQVGSLAMVCRLAADELPCAVVVDLQGDASRSVAVVVACHHVQIFAWNRDCASDLV